MTESHALSIRVRFGLQGGRGCGSLGHHTVTVRFSGGLRWSRRLRLDSEPGIKGIKQASSAKLTFGLAFSTTRPIPPSSLPSSSPVSNPSSSSSYCQPVPYWNPKLPSLMLNALVGETMEKTFRKLAALESGVGGRRTRLIVWMARPTVFREGEYAKRDVDRHELFVIVLLTFLRRLPSLPNAHLQGLSPSGPTQSFHRGRAHLRMDASRSTTLDADVCSQSQLRIG